MFTLLTGVLPVLGNLMANTVLSLISFAVSPWVAVSSLVFLVVIHKLEYVINARTVGSKISMNSWEILAAMLTGESLFGVPGLVTAPLLYPFFKREIARLWTRFNNAAIRLAYLVIANTALLLAIAIIVFAIVTQNALFIVISILLAPMLVIAGMASMRVRLQTYRAVAGNPENNS